MLTSASVSTWIAPTLLRHRTGTSLPRAGSPHSASGGSSMPPSPGSERGCGASTGVGIRRWRMS
eukprot:11140761-Alexandrium_andersonii.AAC.1